jgi:hypothetical protein
MEFLNKLFKGSMKGRVPDQSSTHLKMVEHKNICLSPLQSFQVWSSKAPRRAEHKMFFLGPFTKLPSLELGSFKTSQAQKNSLATNGTSNLQDMLSANCFVFGHQLLVSKVGGQTHKNCLNPFMNFWTWSLEFPTHAKHKFFAFGLQLSAPKVEG